MLAGKIDAPGQALTFEAPTPQVGADDVLIAVQAAGICGTDLHILKGEYEARYPLIPGHEFSGVVAQVGERVTRFQVGDRVTADPNIPCNRCVFCQRNEPNQCENLLAIGVHRDGGFAQYVIAPEGNVFNIGDLSFAQAALVEPLACVVWGLKRVQVQPGDTALVFGAGPMGCLVAQALRQAGAAQVVVTDVVPHRLELAAALGATETILADDAQARRLRDFAPLGFDVVAEATGIPAVLEQSFEFARPRGRVWVFGVVPPGVKASFVPYDVFRKDLSIIGSFAVNRTFHESIALVRSGVIQVEPLISHRLPLADFAAGLELAEHDARRMKVQYVIGGAEG
jgi:D-arabinitol dehydrogenase (NADP+)